MRRKTGGIILLCIISLAAVSQQKTLKVACIGNSVTYGYGLRNRDSASYPVQLQHLLGPGYNVKNFGVSGSTLLKNGHRPYYKTAAFAGALAFAPDIAVIHLGLNDTDPRDWPDHRDEFAPDYAWLIDTIRKANPAVQIYICRLTPIFHDHPRFKSGTRNWFWEIQTLIPRIARANGTGLVDLHTPLYAHPELFADALHPDETGAGIIAQTVYKSITGNYGGLQLALPFASHMVMQRNRPLRFYGTADAGEAVTVAFDNQRKRIYADQQGRWSAAFPAMPAGGPYQAGISTARKTILLKDILIGEVWLCSGQSNMEFPLRNAVQSKQYGNNPDIRLLRMAPLAPTDNMAWDTATLRKVNQLQYFSGRWQRSDTATAAPFSAIGWFFAGKLQQELKVPVGIIEIAVGGSTTESWIDRFTMEQDPLLTDELYHWRTSGFYQPWCRERAAVNLARSTDPLQRHPYGPCYNYEAGIAPFTGFPVCGAIWYQGESNAHNPEQHAALLPALVKSWRRQWGYEFPFYYVQLSSLDRPSWPAFRESQLELLNVIPRTGMAVSIDVGDSTNVHPRRKKEVGDRLAALALHFTYGREKVVPYGPMPQAAKVTGNELVVSFRYAAGGLDAAGGGLRGFALVDDKGTIRPADARIKQGKVVMPLPAGVRILQLRYGGEPFTRANLVNKAGLPAPSFMLNLNEP